MHAFLAVDEFPAKIYALAATLTMLSIMTMALRIDARRMMKASGA